MQNHDIVFVIPSPPNPAQIRKMLPPFASTLPGQCNIAFTSIPSDSTSAPGMVGTLLESQIDVAHRRWSLSTYPNITALYFLIEQYLLSNTSFDYLSWQSVTHDDFKAALAHATLTTRLMAAHLIWLRDHSGVKTSGWNKVCNWNSCKQLLGKVARLNPGDFNSLLDIYPAKEPYHNGQRNTKSQKQSLVELYERASPLNLF